MEESKIQHNSNITAALMVLIFRSLLRIDDLSFLNLSNFILFASLAGQQKHVRTHPDTASGKRIKVNGKKRMARMKNQTKRGAPGAIRIVLREGKDSFALKLLNKVCLLL